MSRARDLANGTFSGTVNADGLALGDNEKALFGTGSDLQIYHNASNSYIEEAGTGDLNIRTNGTNVRIDSTGAAQLAANFNPTGAQTFYYNNSQKLATTSAGVQALGQLEVQSGSNDQLKLYAAEVSSTARSNIDFWYLDGGGSGYQNAQISALAAGNAGNGNLVFSTRPTSGSLTEAMRLYNNQSASFSNYIYPTVDNAFSCGLSGNRWNAIYAANGTIQTSDQRSKTNIIESPLGLDFVLALEPVAYKFKVGKNLVNEDGEVIPVAGARQHFGLISQQVKEVCGEVDFGGWVKTDPEDEESSEGLRYDQFVAPLVKAIQEQQALIEDLQTRLAALEAV